MSVRAKFYISTLEPTHRSDGQLAGNVKLSPVYSSDQNHENKKFWDATPSGSITMYINNPEAFKFFAGQLGKEFYVDFTVAE
jgi:hypothetical protein